MFQKNHLCRACCLSVCLCVYHIQVCNDYISHFFFQFVSIQPNYGFGALLPREEVTLEILYSPTSECAGHHKFSLTCKTTEGGKCTLHCEAHVIKPLAELSHQVIIFPATPCFSYSIVPIYLHANNFTDKTYEDSLCPRKEPKPYKIRYEFQCDNTFVSISPCVGTVQFQEVSIIF